MKIKLLLFVFLFSYNLYSQSLTNEIVLDSNGVTIKCKDSETGFTKNIAGKIYTVVDEALLRNMVNNDEATPEQIDTMISSAVRTAEKYYPAFQLVIYDNQAPETAMQVAIAEAYGHA